MSKSNKPKKPIYKRVWPYILLVCLIGAGAGGAASSEPDEDRGEFAEKRTVITITPEPGEKDTFSIADIVEETPEPLEPLEPETTQAPVTRSAPEVPQPVEETTQEITEEPAEEPAEEITKSTAEEVPAEEPALEPSPTASQEENYVLNTNTYKFHKPYCSSCKDIKPENRSDVTKSRDDIIALGYQPCKICNP